MNADFVNPAGARALPCAGRPGTDRSGGRVWCSRRTVSMLAEPPARGTRDGRLVAVETCTSTSIVVSGDAARMASMAWAM